MDSEFLHQRELVSEHKIFEYHTLVNEEKQRSDIENIDFVIKPYLNSWSFTGLIHYCFEYSIPNTNFSVIIALVNNEIILFLDCYLNSEKKQELHAIIAPEILKNEDLKKKYLELLTSGNLSDKSSHFVGDLKYLTKKEIHRKLINFENADEQTFLCSLAIWYSVNKNS